MTKKKVILFVFAIPLLLAIICGATYLFRVRAYKNKMESITYSNIDITSLPDGTYTGEYVVDFIRAKVEVVICEGQIETIRLLEHYNDRGEAATGIEQTIVSQQRINVDAVSGATNSSNVIKKAVDNALNNARLENPH